MFFLNLIQGLAHEHNSFRSQYLRRSPQALKREGGAALSGIYWSSTNWPAGSDHGHAVTRVNRHGAESWGKNYLQEVHKFMSLQCLYNY
jgi:hypothetical protein